MDRLPEWNERRLLAGGPEPAPKGWTPLSNVVRDFLLGATPEEHPSLFERFAADVPADAEPFDLVSAALWAILERCPTQAILTEEGVPYDWPGLLVPPPPGRRHETVNQYVGLFLGGYVGSGTVSVKIANKQIGERLVGRPVLLRSQEVFEALLALELADAETLLASGVTDKHLATAADETTAGRALLAYLKTHPAKAATKAAIKGELAPDLPDKAWDRAWNAAAKQFPGIRRPGRKRKNPTA